MELKHEEVFILRENNKRDTLYPILYNDIWNLHKTQQACVWFVDEIDLSQDLKNWKKLNSDEQFFIKNILAFFAASDGIVLENLIENFTREVKITESEMFYRLQATMEGIHSEMYSRMIEALIINTKEKDELFNALELNPAVKKKGDWALKWITADKPFSVRLIAFIIVEGVFFSGAFCAIDWLKERKLELFGLQFSNKLISRDEQLHCDHAILLYNNYITNKVSDKEVKEIFIEAINIEKEFITESLPCSLLGMNSKNMKEYIEFVADNLMVRLGYERLNPNSKCPFPFMEVRNIEDMVNFFEHRPGDYQRTIIEDYSKVDFLKEETLELTDEIDF